LHVDDSDLPTLATLVELYHTVEGLLGSPPLLEPVEKIVAILEPGAALSCDRADAGSHPWYSVSDARSACRDRNPALTRPRIDGHDRKGVKLHFIAPARGFLAGDDIRCGRQR
jgi:hypothetical protein